MSVTYGFYNSIKGDRKYNALEMSSIFDGIIVDGVYMSIGDALNVKSSGGMGITVGIGRAWFNHTWTLNDSLLPLTLANSDVLLNRIDAIVLEVNNNTEVRKNTIKILKGTPSSKPVKPTMTEGELLNQHPLAYISIPAGATSISQSNIENAVGTSACPYVTGVLKGMDIDKLVAQWGAQWAEWLSSNTDAWKAFMSDNTNEWKSFMAKNKNEWSALINGNTSEFETWFEHMKDQLSEDAAGNLQLQVDNLNNAALGGDFVLKGSPVSVEYMGANRIASITAYGENAQGGTTEAPMALTGVDSVFVGGRNLLPKATLTETISGVTFTPNPDGSVSVSGTATSDSYYTFAHYMERALLGQTVCLSGSSQLVTVVINERTSSATFVRNVLVDRGQGASGIVTKRKDSNVLYAVLQVQSGDTVNEVVYPMLNLGKSPLPYKPYQGSVTPLPIPRPLHKVGDVRDICCTRVKSVYDKRIVIDQNSIINMSGEASIVGTSRRFNVPAEDIPITNDAVIEPVRCNILPARPSGGVSGTYALDAPGISLQNNQSVSQPNINIRVPGCKTLEEIKAWLTDNPLTVYYQSTSYNGANGLDICLTEYQNGSIELDGTESNLQFFSEYQTLAIKGITTAGDPSQANAYGVCISSHFALVPPGTSTTLDKVVYGQPQYNQIIIHDTSWNSLETAKAYLAAQKAAGTPVQIAYQLATPEVYATDPVDFDNAAGPLTVLTGGELEAAFKSADKVVESRIDFVEDTLNEQGQAIAEKAPISHSSDKSTYGLGSGSQFGHVKLSDATASGSNAGQGIAATPSAVNQVNARVSTVDGIARAAMPKSGGTFTGNVLASSANEAGAFLRNISVQNSASQLQYTNFIIMMRK